MDAGQLQTTGRHDPPGEGYIAQNRRRSPPGPDERLQRGHRLPHGANQQMKPLALLLLAPALFAQPRLQNARQETRAVSGSLDAAFRAIVNAQTAPLWIGYA